MNRRRLPGAHASGTGRVRVRPLSHRICCWAQGPHASGTVEGFEFVRHRIEFVVGHMPVELWKRSSSSVIA